MQKVTYLAILPMLVAVFSLPHSSLSFFPAAQAAEQYYLRFLYQGKQLALQDEGTVRANGNLALNYPDLIKMDTATIGLHYLSSSGWRAGYADYLDEPGGYSAAPYRSKLHASRAQACEQGWVELQVADNPLAGAQARYHNDSQLCHIIVDGEIKTKLPVFDSSGSAGDKVKMLTLSNGVAYVLARKENTYSPISEAGFTLTATDKGYTLNLLTGYNKTYTASGQLASVQVPGVETRYHYNAKGELYEIKNSRGQSIQLRYSAGRLASLTSDNLEDGQLYLYYDGEGRLTNLALADKKTIPAGHDVDVFTASYNAQGLLEKIKNSLSEQHFSYDSHSRITAIYSETALPDEKPTQDTVRIAYAAGEVRTTTQAGTQIQQYAFVNNGYRLVKNTVGENVQTLSYSNGKLSALDNQANGKEQRSASLAMNYDSAGKPLQFRVHGEGKTEFTVAYSYGSSGLAEKILVNNSELSTLQYNADGQPTRAITYQVDNSEAKALSIDSVQGTVIADEEILYDTDKRETARIDRLTGRTTYHKAQGDGGSKAHALSTNRSLAQQVVLCSRNTHIHFVGGAGDGNTDRDPSYGSAHYTMYNYQDGFREYCRNDKTISDNTDDRLPTTRFYKHSDIVNFNNDKRYNVIVPHSWGAHETLRRISQGVIQAPDLLITLDPVSKFKNPVDFLHLTISFLLRIVDVTGSNVPVPTWVISNPWFTWYNVLAEPPGGRHPLLYSTRIFYQRVVYHVPTWRCSGPWYRYRCRFYMRRQVTIIAVHVPVPRKNLNWDNSDYVAWAGGKYNDIPRRKATAHIVSNRTHHHQVSKMMSTLGRERSHLKVPR